MPGQGWKDAVLATLRIRPEPRPIIAGRKARVKKSQGDDVEGEHRAETVGQCLGEGAGDAEAGVVDQHRQRPGSDSRDESLDGASVLEVETFGLHAGARGANPCGHFREAPGVAAGEDEIVARSRQFDGKLGSDSR